MLDDEWPVMFSDDMNHWMFADGLQADVVQIKFICCSAIRVIGCSGTKVTDVTGTVSIENDLGSLLLIYIEKSKDTYVVIVKR